MQVAVLDPATVAMIRKQKEAAVPGGGMPAGGNEAMLKPLRDAIQKLEDQRKKLPAGADGARRAIDQQIDMIKARIKKLGGDPDAGAAAGKRLVRTGKRIDHNGKPCLIWYFMDGKTVLQELHVTAFGNLDVEPAFLGCLKRIANVMGAFETEWFSSVINAGYAPVVVHDFDEKETTRLLTDGKCAVKPEEVRPTPGFAPVKLG